MARGWQIPDRIPTAARHCRLNVPAVLCPRPLPRVVNVSHWDLTGALLRCVLSDVYKEDFKVQLVALRSNLILSDFILVYLFIYFFIHHISFSFLLFLFVYSNISHPFSLSPLSLPPLLFLSPAPSPYL